MELWELVAREQIRDTLARYSHFADSGRFDALVDLFTEDGVLEICGREPHVGRSAIRRFLGNTKTNLGSTLERPYIRHHTTSVVIDLAGPTSATAASYFQAITHVGLDHWGRYRDEFVCVDDRWLFARRYVRPDGHSPDSWRSRQSKAP